MLLGSNEGDRAEVLKIARRRLQNLSSRQIVVSSLYETEPWGFESDVWFLNQAIKIETELDPHVLLVKLLKIEKSLGRVREEKNEKDQKESCYSSRTIDIDILLYDNVVTNTAELQLPHPRMHLRRFALMPLSEINPGMIHPLLRKSIKELLEECPDRFGVIRI